MNAGYKAPVKKKVKVLVHLDMQRYLLGAQGMYHSGYISEHDLKIAKKLALCHCWWSCTIWNRSRGRIYFKLRTRSIFRACSRSKITTRMQHMLVKGKPLRN